MPAEPAPRSAKVTCSAGAAACSDGPSMIALSLVVTDLRRDGLNRAGIDVTMLGKLKLWIGSGTRCRRLPSGSAGGPGRDGVVSPCVGDIAGTEHRTSALIVTRISGLPVVCLSGVGPVLAIGRGEVRCCGPVRGRPEWS